MQSRGTTIVMVSLHGLLRGRDLETGRDADNGGQPPYVMAEAGALSARDDVTRVYLLTRLIEDPTLDPIYARQVEVVNEKFEIHRIPFGGPGYQLKEQLWPHLDEFVTNATTHIIDERIAPDWFHGHYADPGYSVVALSARFGIPFTQTSHSLGRRKLEALVTSGSREDEVVRRYRFGERFAAEEATLAHAAFIICSSREEITSYRDYTNIKGVRFEIIPPGVDHRRFFPYYDPLATDEQKQARESVRVELGKFLRDPGKPLIVALSRADKKKNIARLIEAYGRDQRLKAVANLAIFMGLRDDIAALPGDQASVISEALMLQDKFDLYGKLALPKRHNASDVPAIYRFAAQSRGVFVNAALTEPFGLTILEAAASGVPVVATNQGGPSETIGTLQNGVTVDPYDVDQIGNAVLDVLADEVAWRRRSNLGILRIPQYYSWNAHAERYMTLVRREVASSRMVTSGPSEPVVRGEIRR
jgi:sucrose-phosphate synthase